MANRPIGPQPQIAIVSPCWNVAEVGGHVTGREYIRQEENLLVSQVNGHLDRPNICKRDTNIFGLATRKTTKKVRIAEQACR